MAWLVCPPFQGYTAKMSSFGRTQEKLTISWATSICRLIRSIQKAQLSQNAQFPLVVAKLQSVWRL